MYHVTVMSKRVRKSRPETQIRIAVFLGAPHDHRFAPNRSQMLSVHRVSAGAVTVQVQQDARSAMV